MDKNIRLKYLKTSYLFFLLSVTTCWCQNQHLADSLKKALKSNSIKSDTERLYLLDRIALLASSPDSTIYYAQLSLDLATELNNNDALTSGYYSTGVAYRLKGNLDLSLQHLFKSAKIANEHKLYNRLATTYGEIASTYAANNDNRNAIIYENKAIELLRKYGDVTELASALLNAGYTNYTLDNLNTAIDYYNEADSIFNQSRYPIGKAYVKGNKALVYWKQGYFTKAKDGLIEAIDILDSFGDDYGVADYNNQLGKLYYEQDSTTNATKYTLKGLDLAKQLDLKEQIRDASLLLSELYLKNKNYQEALAYKTQYIAYKDSIENAANTKKMADLRTEYEVSLKDKEILILEKGRLLNRIYIFTVLFLLAFAIVLILLFRQRWKHTRLLAENQTKEHNEKIKTLLSTHETKALQSMIKGQENERKRLAEELHNHFGSLLATIKVNLNAVEDVNIPNYKTLTTLVDQACEDIRNFAHSLHIGISEDFGLVPALRELVQHLKQVNGLNVLFSASMCQEPIDTENEIVIYRIVQELVSNILKHANATKVTIQLTCFEEEGLINIMVEDNGKGFNLDKVQAQANKGMGLKSLEQLIHQLNGEISIDSNTTSGTTVNIDLPLNTEV